MALFGTVVQFADPLALSFLVAVAAGLVITLLRARRPAPGLLFSSIGILPAARAPLCARLRWVPVLVRFLALALFVIALARPQIVHTRVEEVHEGIDIVLATDVSGSMGEATFNGVKKIDAVRLDAKAFVSGLKNDRVGVVIFAGEAVITGPLTLDYAATHRGVRQHRHAAHWRYGDRHRSRDRAERASRLAGALEGCDPAHRWREQLWGYQPA